MIIGQAAIVGIAYLVMLYDYSTPGALWIIPYINLPMLYLNAMMVNFNHRIRIYEGRNDTQCDDMVLQLTDINSGSAAAT